MKTINKIVANPFFLSLIPFLIICIIVPFNFERYSLKSSDKTILQENQYNWYEDLENDGSPEKIIAFMPDNTTAITIQNEDGFIDQWNFKGSFDFWFKTCLFITGDKDENGKKELYVFTLNNDTILLHCISNIRDPGLSIKNRVIAVTGSGNNSPDPFIIPAEMDDLNGDGEKELIFGIGSGFSKHPRNVFAYYISKDSLVKSPESSYFISNILQADINNDNKKEIIPYGYATSNVDPETARYHDCSSFLIVLDQNLKFIFNPIEFRGKYSSLSPIILKKASDGNITLAWMYHSVVKGVIPKLYNVSSSGQITDSVSLDFKVFEPKNIAAWKAVDGLMQVYLPDGIGLVNNNFKVIKTIPFSKTAVIRYQDLDADGKIEILSFDADKSTVSVFREGYKHPVSISADLSVIGPNLVSIKTTNKNVSGILMQSGNKQYLFQYGKNPSYPYYYLYYPGIYLSILLFALSVKNIQKDQSRKKYETEKKIAELQLAMIRNQLDPHFTFNVINSIIYSVEFRENGQAADQLRQFANLYRNMLLSAGSTRRTIEEELDFCKNYLLLEKTRFQQKFNYNIIVANDVDTKLLIPKLLVQIHAENAIKHGLSSLESGGILNIELKNEKGVLIIEITDNGIGRMKSASQEKTTTGKGLETMDELYSIYNKYYGEKISSQITDLYDTEGNPAGTKVSICIRKANE